MKTLYEFESAFQELMDSALNVLSPEQFEKFKKDLVSVIHDDYTE